MRRGLTAAITALLVCVGTSALNADRLNDAQLTQLIESIDQGFDRWKDDLERRNMDDAVIRSAAGTIDVRKFLDEMENDIHQVKDRLKPDYSASTEVTSLLRRASDVERRNAAQGGGSEVWKTYSREFGALAGAYGVAWPMDGAASAQRKMDRELAADAKRLADSVDRLREGSVRAASDAKMPQAERDAADRSMRELKRAAEQLESNLKDHRAVASDAASVLDLSNKALSFAQGVGPMRNEATTAMNVVRSATDAIALAFKP